MEEKHVVAAVSQVAQGHHIAGRFWESGLGRDLNARTPDDMAISVSDLKARWEYRLRTKPKGLRMFNAADAVARRAIGAKTATCGRML